MTTILADGSRAVFGEVTPAQFAAKMRLPGLEGQIYREIDRIRTQYDTEIRTRYPRHWRRVCGYNLDELVKDRPLNMARLIVGSEGTFLTVVEAKMRLVKKPKATAVDVIHYHDMQEALESSQAILETGPYAVELTDKMILDLARMNIEQAGAHGLRAGRSRRDPDRGVRGGHRAGGQGQGRGPRGAADARPLRLRLAHRHRRGRAAVHLEAAQGRPRPAAGHARRVQAHRVHRGHRGGPEAPARVRAALHRDHEQARRGRRLLRPLLGGVPAHPPADQSEDRARPRAGPGDGRGDLRPRALLRRGHLERARRRPGPQPVPGAGVRADHVPGVQGDEGRLRSARADEPGQHRGQPGRHRAPALRRQVQDVGAQDAARLLGAGRLRGRGRDVQRRRGLPQEARGHHVPVLHGHPGRGAHHARARQRAARGAVGPGAGGRLRGQAALRGDGSLPGMQGLQGGVPVQRGHGQDEVRVPAPLPRGQRAAPAQPPVRAHRAALLARVAAGPDLQLDRALAGRTAG